MKKGAHEHKKKRKRKTLADRAGGTMNLILILIGIAGVLFTVTMIVIFWVKLTVPDVLITCFFAALFGECGAMSIIKSIKIRNQDRAWQKEDEAQAQQPALHPPEDAPATTETKEETPDENP